MTGVRANGKPEAGRHPAVDMGIVVGRRRGGAGSDRRDGVRAQCLPAHGHAYGTRQLSLPPLARKLLLLAHLTTSVGFAGAVAAFLVLAISGLNGRPVYADLQLVAW